MSHKQSPVPEELPGPAAEFQSSARAVEAYLSDWLRRSALAKGLREAIAYVLEGGGKRVRPVLVLLSAEAAGGEREAALPAAAAIELVHSFSLVHDDLPAMDDDDLRRGRATLHRHAGEAMAILAGDAMLAHAFELLSDEVRPPGRAAALCRELSRATGEMIAGQVYDTVGGFEPALEPLERLRALHRHKTGALMRCACRLGALCAPSPEPALEALSAYGEAIGLMFQMVDDALDETQSTEHLGKRSRKDRSRRKLTYPGLIGMEATREAIEAQRQRAHACLAPLAPRSGALLALADWLAVRTR